MRHSDGVDDPRTAARQVVEDSEEGRTFGVGAVGDWESHDVLRRSAKAVQDAARLTDRRHTGDQPLTSRRLREGR